jgi:hypothetical protein
LIELDPGQPCELLPDCVDKKANYLPSYVITSARLIIYFLIIFIPTCLHSANTHDAGDKCTGTFSSKQMYRNIRLRSSKVFL